MSDRNENQTLMANSGQMFASGGIARLAEGGALPKYKYDPVSQTYVLSDDSGSKTAMDETLQRQQRPAVGDIGSYDSKPSAWDLMSDKDKAAYYAENPRMAKVTQTLQSIFGKTGLGAAQRGMFPDFVARQEAIARGIDTSLGQYGTTGKGSAYGVGVGSMLGINAMDAMSDAASSGGYGTTGPGSATGVGVGSTIGINAMDAMSDAAAAANSGGGGFAGADPGGMMGGAQSGDVGFAYGGLASLARGGMSHLGDYSDGGRLLRGPGDGVSDSIPATIGNKRPARLADGEFVVPARIVSELGNGSTEAGARKLYAMMDRIQKGRKKSIGKNRVAVNSRADKNLPA
jgi:hypothetical protein